MTKKRFRVFAGPNGSGKSSLYDFLVKKKYFTERLGVNADQVYFFDNSESGLTSYQDFAECRNGKITIETDEVPEWFDTYVLKKLENR